MSNKLICELIKSGYTIHGAESAAKQIAGFHSKDIRDACQIRYTRIVLCKEHQFTL